MGAFGGLGLQFLGEKGTGERRTLWVDGGCDVIDFVSGLEKHLGLFV